MLHDEFDDAWFSRMDDELTALRFPGGITATTFVGRWGHLGDFRLELPRRDGRVYGQQTAFLHRRGTRFRIDEEDEAAFTALQRLHNDALQACGAPQCFPTPLPAADGVFDVDALVDPSLCLRGVHAVGTSLAVGSLRTMFVTGAKLAGRPLFCAASGRPTSSCRRGWRSPRTVPA